jgi:hypothetical protein
LVNCFNALILLAVENVVNLLAIWINHHEKNVTVKIAAMMACG